MKMTKNYFLISLSIYLSIHLSIYLSIYLYINVYITYTHTHTHTPTHTHTHTRTHTYIHVHTRTHTRVHTHTHWPPCPPIILIIWRWCYVPRAEARVTLGSIISGIRYYFYPPHQSIFSLSFQTAPASSVSVYITSVYDSISASFVPYQSMTSCSHHRFGAFSPGCRSASRHSSNIELVSIYWEMLFWWRLI